MILKGKEQTADQLGTSDPKEQPSGQFSRFSFCLMYLGLGVEKLATLKQQQTLPPPKKNPQENHIFYSKEGKGQPD